MEVGQKVWIVSYGNVIRTYTEGVIERATPKRFIVKRADRNNPLKFDRETLNSVPYSDGYRLNPYRPEDGDRMRPSYGQRLVDSRGDA